MNGILIKLIQLCWKSEWLNIALLISFYHKITTQAQPAVILGEFSPASSFLFSFFKLIQLNKRDPCTWSISCSLIFRGAFSTGNSSIMRLCRFDGLEAHPPSYARHEILDFAPNMPQCLPIQFFPQNQYWEDIFQGECPDMDDVGLYFFPNEVVNRFALGLLSFSLSWTLCGYLVYFWHKKVLNLL